MVRGALTLDASKAVVHAFVSSRVDYCNSVFSFVCVKNLRPLQSVLNVRDQLHWLPIAERIEYKLCSLVYKYFHQVAPQYLVEMCKVVSLLPGRRNLPSASRGALVELRTKSSTYGPRSFAVCDPRTWNGIAIELTWSLTVPGTI